MELKWLAMVLVVLSLGAGLCDGCLEDERFALFQLKPFFEFINYRIQSLGFESNPEKDFELFYEKESSSNCCEWEKVECNPITGRVTHLFLNYSTYKMDWYLNASLFLPFEELQNLSLSGNSIAGCAANQGFERLSSKLDKLENLDLSRNHFNDSILSSLSELSSLKSLNLGYNIFTGSNHTNGIEMLSKLNNLETLDLSGNSLGNNILSQLDGFASLKSLRLENCGLNGTLDIQESNNNWMNLKELYLGGNEIESLGSLFHEKEGMKFNKLEVLSLYGNEFNNSTFSSLVELSNLKILDLSYNQLEGTIYTKDFCELINLQELEISGNNLRGILPMCFSNLTSLKELSLSSNQFSGNISALKSLTLLESLDLSSNQFSGNISALESLTSLQWLDISNNKFHIPSSLRPLFNLSKLKYINADNNTIHADDHEMLHSSAPRFQLNSISLSCCGSGGSFPQFLYHQCELQEVTLSDIYFKVDRFPFWLLENNTMLVSLDLVNCSLSGPFQAPSHVHSALSYLDISNNAFGGNIPLRIGAHLPSLWTLNMSRNYFNGSIPSSFGDMSSLEVLDLSNNQLSGEIPEHMATGCSLLEVLALSNNTLQGSIFSENFNLTSLSELELNGNNFTGMIPNVLANCSDLYILDLSNNFIFGEVPSWIWNMSWLIALDVSRNRLFGRLPQWRGNASNLEQVAMADNQLKGTMPRAICSLNLKLQFLDLSMNSLSGTLPSCFKPVSVREVLLSKNMLQGPLPNAFRDSSLLVTLDLNYNHLKGNIPNWVSNLSYLSYLLLKGNHFEGEIPIQLCKLNHLSLVDLSQNNLSGGIPSCLKVAALNYVINQNFSFVPNKSSGVNSKSIDVSIEYTVKSRSYNYKKRMLQYMSGIDLSCNKLTGEISFETKSIMQLFTLNLSHNSLTGPIPRAFSNLEGIESLDLSYNKLTGNIPVEFAVLHFLGYFNVSYNNLSGKTPERIGQLGAFDESSYVGNPFLCGSLVGKNCSFLRPPLTPKDSTGNKEDHGFIDMDAFYASFFACYMMVLLCIAAVLYINPYWRQAWLYYVQMVVDSCYYFVVDNLSPKIFVMETCS